MSTGHDLMGRVLKCHLIIEHYLDRFLAAKHHIDNIEDARLTFSQKAKLLPNAGSAVSFVKPGILKLNAIRNRFGHRLEAHVEVAELGPINEVLKVARPGVDFVSGIERIEAFTTVACTWLLVNKVQIQRGQYNTKYKGVIQSYNTYKYIRRGQVLVLHFTG